MTAVQTGCLVGQSLGALVEMDWSEWIRACFGGEGDSVLEVWGLSTGMGAPEEVSTSAYSCPVQHGGHLTHEALEVKLV